MHNILDIFQNRILLCGVASWFVAQALKVPLYWFVEKELNWKRFFGSGGMPSSHTAFVVSLALMVSASPDVFGQTSYHCDQRERHHICAANHHVANGDASLNCSEFCDIMIPKKVIS